MVRMISIRGHACCALLSELTKKRCCTRADVAAEALDYIVNDLPLEDLRIIAGIEMDQLPLNIGRNTPSGSQFAVDEEKLVHARKAVIDATGYLRVHNSYILKLALTALYLKEDRPEVLASLLASEEPVDSMRIRLVRKLLDADLEALREIDSLLASR